MKFAHWKCQKCGCTWDRVNTDHARWTKGAWKVGSVLRTLCSSCRKVQPHEIVEIDFGDEPTL